MATAEQLRAAQELARARAAGTVNYSQGITSPSTPKPSSGMSSTYSTSSVTGLNKPTWNSPNTYNPAGTGTNQSARLNELMARGALNNGVPSSSPTMKSNAQAPAYGSNIYGFDPNNPIHKKIADLGSQWWSANPADRAGIASQAQTIGQGAGGVYNPQSGTWVFANQETNQPTNQYDPNMFSSASFIREQQRLAEQAARQQAYEASNLADAQSLQGGQRLQEVLAARGLGASGENITATAQQQAARQGALTDIQNQLAGNIRDIGAQAQQKLLDDLYRSQDISREQKQFDIQNALQEAQLTGQYLPPGAQDYISNINRLKELYATPGLSKEQRAAITAEASKNRSGLESLGVDSSLFGADVTASQSLQNVGKAGKQTLSAQELAWNRDPANPINQSRLISNEIDRLQLSALPAEIKANLALLNQRVKSGDIDLQQAQYELRELTDPNSVTNQIRNIDLQNAGVTLSNNIARGNNIRSSSGSSGSSGGGSTGGGVSASGAGEAQPTKLSASALNSLEKSLKSQYGSKNPKGDYFLPQTHQGKVNLINEILDQELSESQTKEIFTRFGLSLKEVNRLLTEGPKTNIGDLR